MTDAPYDFAVLGSNPLALLLAGLLATVHKKSVCLVVETHSSFRLTRGFDLSVGPITRPETWLLLKRTVPEVRKLLASLSAKTAVERIDPQLVAETEAGAEALMHVRHLMLAHDIAIERLTGATKGTTYRVRDALLLNRGQLAGPAAKWLERSKVRRIAADGATVTLRRDGARIERGDEVVEATHLIAADDNAVLAHLDQGERERVLRAESATTLLTEPMRALPSLLTLIVDRGVVLMQRKGGGVQALSASGAESLARIGARLAGQGRVRRAGQTGYGALVPLDGAPLVGPVKALKASVVSGLGPVGAFLAPAIARYFAEAASPEEQTYFAAREAAKDTPRLSVADFSGALALGSAS